jgi:hypothetical protein
MDTLRRKAFKEEMLKLILDEIFPNLARAG